jgi:hypothetical protein
LRASAKAMIAVSIVLVLVVGYCLWVGGAHVP